MLKAKECKGGWLADGIVSATQSPLEWTTCAVQHAHSAHPQKPRARQAQGGDVQERLSRQAEISHHQTAPEASFASVSLQTTLLLHTAGSERPCDTLRRTWAFVCSQQPCSRGRVEDSQLPSSCVPASTGPGVSAHQPMCRGSSLSPCPSPFLCNLRIWQQSTARN